MTLRGALVTSMIPGPESGVSVANELEHLAARTAGSMNRKRPPNYLPGLPNELSIQPALPLLSSRWLAVLL